MYENLKGKKLLLLGGVVAACQIVKEAQSMGVKVYVTDYLPDSPAKKIADKSFMVSTTDIDAVVNLCKEEKIDGVITGYIDSLLPYCQKICNKLGLPFCGNAQNINMCIDKATFKLACEQSNVMTVPWVKLTKENYLKKIEDMEFPLIFKPVDNSGSRGVVKCYSPENVESSFCSALDYSKSGVVISEKLMNKNNEFSVYYMLYNNKAYLSGMGDRFVYSIDDTLAPSGLGMIFPSCRLAEWKEKMDEKVRRFFKNNDMRNGFVFLQGFYEKGEFYIHEIGYRLNGGYSYKIIESFCGYNQIKELINYSITGKMNESQLEKSDAEFDGIGFILTISLKQGVISSIRGFESVKEIPGVIDICQMHYVGDHLTSKGTTAQVLAYILCAIKNKEELKYILDEVKKEIEVFDENKNSMLMPIIKYEQIFKG